MNALPPDDVVDDVTLADIEAAREVLSGVIRTTETRFSRSLSERIGVPVHLKYENQQRAGSFKIRGAYTRMTRLTEAERARGVVAGSAGNHAQGVALAASMLGIEATVFMPRGAPMPKVAATEAYGARIEFVGTTVDDCILAARERAESTGAVLIPTFDHPDIVAGQGTVGLEVLEQCPEVRTIVCAAGGGGLIAGVARAVKATRPDVRVIGVQAQTAASFGPSLEAGHPVALTQMATMADGIAVARPGAVPFALIRDLVDDMATVSEDSIARALVFLMERAKAVVEPAGGVTVAHLLDLAASGHAAALEGPVVAVLSGGNIDPLLMLRVIRSGLAAGGRFLQFEVHVPDKPGSLAALLATVAEAGANVLSVNHSRISTAIRVDEVAIAMSVETRGTQHSDELVQALEAQGLTVRRD